MPELFDAYEYAAYLRRRWKFFAVACGSAAAIAFLVSLLLERQYTATVNVLIEPGGDSRSANAISPVYLESLRTYETFASSDGTFAQAMDHFHLRDSKPDVSLQSLKKMILDVSKLRDTRILQISATLHDPRQALALAQYVAGQTVGLSQSVNQEVEEDSIAAAEKNFAEAKSSRDRAESEWTNFPERGSIDTLQENMSSLVDLKSKVHRQLISANAEAASWESQARQAKVDSVERERANSELAAAQARVASLSKQASDTDREFERKNPELSRLIARRDTLQDNLDTAARSYESAENKLSELRNAAGFRRERLKIIDNGAVPSRPSSPKTLLNVEAALLLAFVASLVFLSFSFTAKRRAGESTAPYRLRA